jgi:hypothetical protein
MRQFRRTRAETRKMTETQPGRAVGHDRFRRAREPGGSTTFEHDALWIEDESPRLPKAMLVVNLTVSAPTVEVGAIPTSADAWSGNQHSTA